MNENKDRVLPSDESIVSQLIEEISTFLNNVGVTQERCENGYPIPSKKQLKLILSIVFWVSLQKEEGRSLAPALIYCPKGKSRGTLVFNEPLDFSVEAITKLAPTAISSQKAIAIYDAGDGLKVWGLADKNDFAFSIKILEEGSLFVKYWGGVFMVFKAGEPKFLVKDNHFNLESLLDVGHQNDPQIAEHILDIAKSMFQQGHGGTLLIVNKASNTWDSHLTDFRYDCSSTTYQGIIELKKYLFSDEDLNKWGNTKEEMRNILRKALDLELDSIGKLTSVDGAVIVNTDLEVLGFGAMVKKGSPNMPLEIKINEAGDITSTITKPLQKLGGARHTAAAEYCFLEKSSVAIVASQDQVLTLIKCDENEISAWRNIQLYLL